MHTDYTTLGEYIASGGALPSSALESPDYQPSEGPLVLVEDGTGEIFFVTVSEFEADPKLREHVSEDQREGWLEEEREWLKKTLPPKAPDAKREYATLPAAIAAEQPDLDTSSGSSPPSQLENALSLLARGFSVVPANSPLFSRNGQVSCSCTKPDCADIESIQRSLGKSIRIANPLKMRFEVGGQDGPMRILT